MCDGYIVPAGNIFNAGQPFIYYILVANQPISIVLYVRGANQIKITMKKKLSCLIHD